jgi:hypothetical protein
LATFISNYAETNRNPDENQIQKLTNDIKLAHKRAVQLFGPHTFTFSKDGRSRFNAAVFDAQMVACAKLNTVRFNTLDAQKEVVRNAYEDLQQNVDFARSVTLATSDKAALQGRIHKVTSLLKNI